MASDPKKHPVSEKYGLDWNIYASDNAHLLYSSENIQTILLQEIRDELQRLNTLLYCKNFTGIPKTLRTINSKLRPRVRRKSR